MSSAAPAVRPRDIECGSMRLTSTFPLRPFPYSAPVLPHPPPFVCKMFALEGDDSD